MPVRTALPLAVALAALLAAGGCDTSFDPFEESDHYYSIMGYLDGRADRQWVRVEALQDSVLAGSGGPLDARVTTEHVATGEQVVWRDSVFQIGVGGSVTVHNFWTRAEMQPGQTYRFRVERRSDGAASTAEVTLPESFPPLNTTSLVVVDEGPPFYVRVSNVERLGAVQVFYRYSLCTRGVCQDRASRVSHLADTTRMDDGTYIIEVDWWADVTRFVDTDRGDQSLGEVYACRVTVAAAGPDWPAYEWPVPGPGAPAPPQPPAGGASNVENGTGFLGAAVTRTVDVPIE